MPNYSLVVNSQFKPFSYEEMLAPVMMATQAHQELENQYAELSQKASIWEEMANEQTDPYAYKMYKTYSNDLNKQADTLAREGLNAVSRRDMLNMKARYSKEITPIEQAYTARQKHIESQRQDRLKDNSLIYDRDASTTSLDDYIRNPKLTYRAISGNTVATSVAQAAANLTRQMKENPRKWRSILGGSYYETMMQKGYTPEEVLLAAQQDPSAPKELTKIVDDAINASGVRSWEDPNSLKVIRDYANKGLWSAVGETQYQTLQNPEYMNPLQRLQYKKALQESRPQYQKVSLIGNPKNLDRKNDLSEVQKEFNKYNRYFDPKTGLLTKEGLKEYNKVYYAPSPKYPTIMGQQLTPISSSFKMYMDQLNGGKPITDQSAWGPWAARRFKDLRDKEQERMGSLGYINADTYRDKYFDAQFSDQSHINDIIHSLPSSKNLHVMKFTKDGYVDDTTININDSKFKNATYSGEYGIQGNFVVITTTKGDQYRVPLKEVHPSLDEAITNDLNMAREAYYKSDGTKYTSEELNKIINTGKYLTTRQDEINRLINSAGDNFTASFMQVKAEPRKVTGGLH